jgi:anti-sigma regulatory factor (Ser/Thr protein kinase)
MIMGEPLRTTSHATRTVPISSRVLAESFDIDGLARVRSAVAAYADALGAGEALDDIVLTAYELCSNAVKHGGGSGRLRLWREGDKILCRVSDSGLGMADPAGRGLESPGPFAIGGRGLWIARRLADVDIETGPHGTTVTAAVTVQP